jgi:glycosyltransferase involved in cell wall biosynthesis
MIGQKGIPATYGGIEKHVEELSIRLVEHGHEVTVFCRPYYTDQGIKSGLVKKSNGKYIYKGVKLSLLPSINTKHLDAITHTVVSTLATLFTGFDIVHYHALGPGLVSFLPWLLSKAVVSTVHGLDWQRAKWRGLAVWGLKLGELSIVYFSQRRIVVSKTLKNYFQQKHGIDCASSIKPGEISKKYGLRGKDYILFVGRLVPEKGCHYLIDAFRGLNTSKKLVIVGGTSHSDDYQNKQEILTSYLPAMFTVMSLMNSILIVISLFSHPSWRVYR